MRELTYKEIEEHILEIPKFSKKTSKENLLRIYDKLDIKDMKIIHVAGTNGKGSVCAFLTSIFLKAGMKVGTFVSPHLVSMTERIKVDGEDVSEEEFTKAYQKIKEVINTAVSEGAEIPSYFETLFLMAMLIFSRANLEYVILETGLGGRLDATNIFENPVISIITSISLDHMEILGDTIEKITAEKAGIIKWRVPVVFYGEDEKVRKVIEDTAKLMQAESYDVRKRDILAIKKNKNNIAFSAKSGYYEYKDIEIPFIAEYQVINAIIVLSAIDVLRERYGISIDEKAIYEGLRDTKWEARMEQIVPNVYLDGAHNDEGIRTLVHEISRCPAAGKKLLLFGAVKEKQYDEMIKNIAEDSGCSEFFVTRIDNARSLSKEVLVEEFQKHIPMEKIHAFDDVKTAFVAAMKEKKEEDVLFIAGSLYLAGEIKITQRKVKDDDKF